tara:strand:- start:632 stop:1888 length:1257 start_codon:yes stop_codon:yes gene_type:complete
MATHDYNLANQSGASFRSDLNNALAAILSNNSSASSPSTTVAYMLWADTNSNTLKIRNSANNAWIELLQLDGTLTLEDGSQTTPGLAFRNDLNTGIFSGGADKLNIATGGTERIEIGTTAIVVNESGADIDFRIEGDTEQNLFFVNGETDRIGIGTAAPLGNLEIKGNNPNIRFNDSDSNNIGEITLDDTSLRIECDTTNSPNGSVGSSTIKFMIDTTTIGILDSTGSLGLGTTNLTKGHLSMLSNNPNIRLDDSNTDNNAEITLDDNSLRIEVDEDNESSITSPSIKFRVKASQKAVIDVNGNFGVAKVSPAEKIDVVGNIAASGTIAGGSDIAYKKDIEPLKNVLNKVTQLLGVNFTYKDNNQKSMGLLAQDVEKIFPELISGEEGEKKLNYSGLTGAIVEAIKELSAKVDALETS